MWSKITAIVIVLVRATKVLVHATKDLVQRRY